MPTLLLLRHAEAASAPPGRRDADRPLTDRGREQAAAVGHYLRTSGVRIDAVLCSTAVRTRQTLAGLGLPDEVPVDLSAALYEAGTDTILTELAALPERVAVALVVGHAPSVPGAVLELADPDTSDRDALAAAARHFPPATLARLETADPWPELALARLAGLRLG